MTEARHNAQYRYQVYCVSLTCNQPLPELPELGRDDGEGFVNLSILEAARQGDRYQWFHHWPSEQSSSSPHCMIAREPAGFHLRYPGIADFVVGSGARSVRCIPIPGVAQNSVRHAFLDGVLPRLLCHLGLLIVHASAVRSPTGTGIAFLGGSGWGKSTLASAFHAHGYRLLADDGLQLKVAGSRLLGVAAYAGARLFDDSAAVLFSGDVRSTGMAHYSSKRRLEIPSSGTVGSAELMRLYFLNDPAAGRPAGPEPVSIAELKGSEAAIGLIRRAYMLDVEDKGAMTRQFDLANRAIASGARFFALRYPRDYGKLDDVINGVEQSLRTEPPSKD